MNDKKLADVLNDLNRHDQDLQRQMVGTACRQAFQLYKAAVLDLVYALGERDGRLARAEAEVALLRGLVGQLQSVTLQEAATPGLPQGEAAVESALVFLASLDQAELGLMHLADDDNHMLVSSIREVVAQTKDVVRRLREDNWMAKSREEGERLERLEAEADVERLKGLLKVRDEEKANLYDSIASLNERIGALSEEVSGLKADSPYYRGNSAPTTNPRGEPCPASSAR